MPRSKPKNLGRGLSALLGELEPDQTTPVDTHTVPIAAIKPNPHQPRRSFDERELSDLAASIKAKGVIQPLIVRSRNDGVYELIAGERRLRASKMGGITEVPVRVLPDVSETEMLELSLIENLQRNDLNPVELAEGYRALTGDMGLTQAQVAKRVGKDRATVTNTLRLLELPREVLDALRSGAITAGHAKAILQAEGAARRSALCKKVIAGGFSVRQTEEAAKRIASLASLSVKRRSAAAPAEEFAAFTDRIRRALGTKVVIARKGKRGRIQIEFYSVEELERLVDLLSKVKE